MPAGASSLTRLAQGRRARPGQGVGSGQPSVAALVCAMGVCARVLNVRLLGHAWRRACWQSVGLRPKTRTIRQSNPADVQIPRSEVFVSCHATSPSTTALGKTKRRARPQPPRTGVRLRRPRHGQIRRCLPLTLGRGVQGREAGRGVRSAPRRRASVSKAFAWGSAQRHQDVRRGPLAGRQHPRNRSQQKTSIWERHRTR